MRDEFLWCEKYRPKTIEDTILPPSLKKTFEEFVKQKNIPNFLLSGSSGVGKTTVARAMLDQIECDYLLINGSNEGRSIEVLRTTITDYASSVSMMGGRKYIIMDEADYMNALSVQPALRAFMEEFSKNCGFIFTCNYANKIIPALRSRCSEVVFNFTPEELKQLQVQFFKRVQIILKEEGIEFDKAAVAGLIQKYYPDWRRVLNELQHYSASGKIDSGILAQIKNVSLDELIGFMKDKNYTEVRKWAGENSQIDSATFFRTFYDDGAKYFTPDTLPLLILLLGKYQYQAAFVADPEINNMSFLTDVVANCEFK